MSDLFAEVDPSQLTADPRVKQRMAEPAAVPQGPPRLRDSAHIQQILRETLAEEFPSAADIAKYKGEGWQTQTCHRWKFEDIEYPVAGLLSPPKSGAISVPHFQWIVKAAIDKANLGSFHSVLVREQGNGLWVPCEVATKVMTVPKNDLLRKARFVSPEAGIEEWDEYPPMEMAAMAVEVVVARIRWVDVKNAAPIEYDAQGQPLTGPRININAGVSPEVAATLERIAASGSSGDRTAEALMAVVAEMKAAREAATIQPPKGVDPQDPAWKAAEAEVAAVVKEPAPARKPGLGDIPEPPPRKSS
jgi:hypothetical protein